MLVIQPGGS